MAPAPNSRSRLYSLSRFSYHHRSLRRLPSVEDVADWSWRQIKLFPGVKSQGKLRNSHDTRFRYACTSSMERECLAPQQKQRNPWVQWRCSSMCFLICFMIHMIFQFCLLFRISCAIETKTNGLYMFLQMVKAVKGNNPRQATQPLKQF